MQVHTGTVTFTKYFSGLKQNILKIFQNLALLYSQSVVKIVRAHKIEIFFCEYDRIWAKNIFPNYLAGWDFSGHPGIWKFLPV